MVIGTRPQLIKAAVLRRHLERLKSPPFDSFLIDTGQHYDDNLSGVFYRELGLEPPQHQLAIGSASPGRQVGRMLENIEPILQQQVPDAVLVFGDTNSTLAGALAATQLDRPLVHVEAGERLYRRRGVPEEMNRVIADHLSQLCLTATRRAALQLNREGIVARRVAFTGDLHYDLYCWAQQHGPPRRIIFETLGIEPPYVLATLHRGENTDDPDRLMDLIRVLQEAPVPVLLPAHPRLRQALEAIRYQPTGSLRLIQPLGYFDMIALLKDARICVTDSGGLIREAFFAHTPTLVPMPVHCFRDLEWSGWSVALGLDVQDLARRLHQPEQPAPPPDGLFGDGHAAEKIVGEIHRWLQENHPPSLWSPRAPQPSVPDETHSRTAFTLNDYKRLLHDLADHGYRFAGFGEVEQLLDQGERFVLIRHDVRLSMASALKMAQCEAEAGVRTTYCLMPGSAFYNLLEPAANRAARQLLELGHWLGLHIDATTYASRQELSAACRDQASLLAQWFGCPIALVSLDPSREVQPPLDPCLTEQLPPTVTSFLTKSVHHFGDDGGNWRPGHPGHSEAFATGRPLHLSVHPVWYQPTPTSSRETLEGLMDRHMQGLRQRFQACDPTSRSAQQDLKDRAERP